MSDKPKKKPAPRVVAIDSQILVWGIRKKGPQERCDQARWLFQELEDEDAQIIVPSVVLAEFLTKVEDANRLAVVSAVSGRFRVVPFDIKAAALAAELFVAGRAARTMKKTGSRNCLKADSMIVASAKVHGARTFYTDDGDCLKLAKRAGIVGERLPKMAPDLFS